MRSTCCFRAPNAIRTPISFVRRVTAYAMTPYKPKPASRSASAPKKLAMLASIRSFSRYALMRCFIVWTPVTFSRESITATARCMSRDAEAKSFASRSSNVGAQGGSISVMGR